MTGRSSPAIELVLTLGSEWSVYWPHVAESVAAEADLIRSAQAAAVPVYGICYGNQIMAHALGGTVERARQPEIGWHQVVSDLPEVIAEGPWMQWHYDVVTVPADATELARSAIGPQAWRMGHSFCTQFHPEATETMIRRWANSDGGTAELLKYGMKPDQLIDESRRNVADSQPAAEHLVDWFLDRRLVDHRPVTADAVQLEQPVGRGTDRDPSRPCRARPGGSA